MFISLFSVPQQTSKIKIKIKIKSETTRSIQLHAFRPVDASTHTPTPLTQVHSTNKGSAHEEQTSACVNKHTPAMTYPNAFRRPRAAERSTPIILLAAQPIQPRDARTSRQPWPQRPLHLWAHANLHSMHSGPHFCALARFHASCMAFTRHLHPGPHSRAPTRFGPH